MALHLGAERRPWPLMDTCLDDGDLRAYWGIAPGCSHPCSRMQPTRASREGPLYCRTCCRPPTKKLEHRPPRSSSAKLARHQWLGKVCVSIIDGANQSLLAEPDLGMVKLRLGSSTRSHQRLRAQWLLGLATLKHAQRRSWQMWSGPWRLGRGGQLGPLPRTSLWIQSALSSVRGKIV